MILVLVILSYSGSHVIGPCRKNDLIRLNTTLRNTTDSVLCQWTLGIQCNYDTADSSGSFADNGVFDFNVHDKATESSRSKYFQTI